MSVTIELSYTQAYEALSAMVAGKVMTPVFLEGPPGIAKTTLALDIAEANRVPRDVAEGCVFRPSLHDPADLLGVPFVDREGSAPMTRWAQNAFLPNVNAVADVYGCAVLVLDEIAQATPMMQNALAGLMLDRALGEFRLDPRVHIISTGNRVQDKAGAGRILTQVMNRMCILRMHMTLDDWIKWAYTVDIDPLMVAFHRYKAGASLFDFDPNRQVNATPRSWAAVARLPLDGLSRPVQQAMVAGTVGDGHAIEYLEFRQIFSELPTPEEVLLNPEGAPVPESPSAKFGALWQMLKVVTDKNLDRVILYAERYGREYQAAFFNDLVTKDAALARTKAFGQWARAGGLDALL
jgi:hypothetical protein